ncbi:hypothetical protein C4E24_04840 [ANME-1 cluster archaeon AG-394-G21]|nr:hypothetical protein [ANME-1 cluster archaeon AG-394-G21]
MKGKAIIGIAMAAIMVVSVLAVAMPMAVATSDGSNFNTISGPATQKVLIGQNLQFEGYGGTVTVSRIVSGDIENVYQTNANNRIYNVNWPTSGAYYVNYRDSTGYDAQLAVELPDIPLRLKVGTRKVASLAVGTNLIIDTAGMNLFAYDIIDLVVIGPDGQIKHDEVNNQQFTGITVDFLTSNYGSAANTVKTSGWTIGDYTFKVKTKQENACGLEAASVIRDLEITRGEINITAEKPFCVELQTVKLAVTGVADDPITVEASPLSRCVMFKGGIDDTPTGANYHGNWFNSRIDADGIRTYAVKFNDTGTYTIIVTVTGGCRKGDYDTVDITVSEKGVVFDLPSTVVIGEKLAIKGIANTGTYVDVFIDDILYPKLYYLLIGADGTFSKEIRTTDVGMTVPGLVTLKAWLDCAKRPGESPPTTSAEGSAAILVLKTHLDATISNTTVALGDSFDVFGNASSDYVEIVLLSPDGGNGTGMDGLYGTTIYTVPTYCNSTNAYNYYKKLKVDSDADNGNYTIIVLNPGRDNAYGDSEYTYIDSILDLDGDGPEPGVIDVSNKTQKQIAAIISDRLYATGSDDFIWIGNIKIA